MDQQNTKADSSIYFSKNDFLLFREWLQLNMQAISWHYHNLNDFEEFWETIFLDGLSLEQINDRFKYLNEIVTTGPLLSWFNWLHNHFLCFTFVTKDCTIHQLSLQTDTSISILSTTLRNHFIDEYPQFEEFFNHCFQISHLSSAESEQKFSDLCKEIDINEKHIPNLTDDVMTTMEITLYRDWKKLLRKVKKDLYGPHLDISKIKFESSAKNQLKIIRDLIILIAIGIFGLWAIQYGNTWYEKYLVDQIKIYEPNFLTTLSKFSTIGQNEEVSDELKRSVKDIEDVKVIDNLISTDIEKEVFTTESDITITSWGSLPRNFDVAKKEESLYEEERKGGYRDLRYGTNRVYRIMMRSVNPETSKVAVNKLLQKYHVTQADKVQPGTYVPGGIYYNLFVPINNLKEFLSQVMEEDEAILFENKTTRGKTPRGMNKVLIWIKSV